MPRGQRQPPPLLWCTFNQPVRHSSEAAAHDRAASGETSAIVSLREERLDLSTQSFVAVLHPLLDNGPDLRIAAFPLRDSSVPEIGQIGNANFARKEAADSQIPELGKESGPG